MHNESIEEDLPKLDEVAGRLKYLRFSEKDEERVKSVDSLLEPHLDHMMDQLYAHFMSAEQTSAFFPNQAVLARAKSAQRAYFARLTKGNYDLAYVLERWQIGTTHHRIQLDPKWYLGAYCFALTFFEEVLREKLDQEQYDKSLESLTKLIFFDMSYAIDTYILAKERALKEKQDSIRLLETEKKVTKNILESAPVGIIRLDRELIISEVNEEFVAMANEDNRQEIIGKHLEEVCPGLKSERFTQAIKIGQTYQVQAETGVFDKEDSRFFDWAVWPVASDLSGGDGMVCMFTNITDRVMLQQQREDFVATLTHDLKTPILAANRALTLLMEGDFGDVSADQKEVLSTIHQSNDALYNLVLTLLDVYRYDSGAKSIEPAPNDLNDLVQRIGSEFKNASQQKKISLEISCPDEMKFVLIDAEEIRRVLQNFIDNSLKYSAAGASVVIRLSYSDKEALVTVEDTGRGISQEDKSKLFQRFWKSSSGGRYYASTGLGLYLCSRIIDQHQGRIWCDSVLGKGSTFGFAIPLMEI